MDRARGRPAWSALHGTCKDVVAFQQHTLSKLTRFMRRLIWLLSWALLLAAGSGQSAHAQKIARAALGGATGIGGGAVVTLSAVVWRARFQREYLDSMHDLLSWQSVPMIAGPVIGTVFGLAGADALRGTIVGGSVGMLAGAVAGTGIGWLYSATAESPWAGAVIGAGLGLTAGALFGGLSGWSQDEDPGLEFPGALRFGFSVPAP